MEAVFLKLVNMSFTAGWLVIAAVLFRLIFKRAPKYLRCVLWALVAVRLILPFSFESVLSIIPSAEPVPQDFLYAAEPEINTGIGAVNSAFNETFSEQLAPNPGDSVNPTQVLSFVFSIVWLAGAAVLLIYAAISYIRLLRRVSEAALLKDNVWICDKVDSPFILGIVKPKIYIPSSLSDEDMLHVLAHENAHIRRKDHLWKPLGYLLLCVYWFNPLIWVAYILLCRDIELACDEKVVKEMGDEEKKEYSTALLSLSIPRRMIAACPLAFGEVGVKSRIKGILNYKKPAFWIIAIAVIACIVLSACLLTNPKAFVDEDSVAGVSINNIEISEEAANELIKLINTSGRSAYSKDHDDRDYIDDLKAEIKLKSGESYLVHYWYSSGFSVDPLHFGEDDFYTIVTKYDADGRPMRAWKMEYEFDAKFKDWHERSRGMVEYEANLVGSFITTSCIYMNPLSSSIGIAGMDIFILSDVSLTHIDRDSGTVMSKIAVDEKKWRSVDKDEWESLFDFALSEHMVDMFDAYENPMRMELTDEYSLFEMDGSLWIAKISANGFAWSVYELGAYSADDAEWEYSPAVSWTLLHAFPFEFDFEYTHIKAACATGNFNDINSDDKETEIQRGEKLYWYPKYNGAYEITAWTDINFVVYNGENEIYRGIIYVEAEKQPTKAGYLFRAGLMCNGLEMTQGESGGGYIYETERVISPLITLPSYEGFEESELGLAINSAIRKHHQSDDLPDGLVKIAAFSEIVSQNIIACGDSDENSYEHITSLVAVLYREYQFDGAGLKAIYEQLYPAAITFDVTDGDYKLIEYVDRDVPSMFSGWYAEAARDIESYREELEDKSEERADSFLKSITANTAQSSLAEISIEGKLDKDGPSGVGVEIAYESNELLIFYGDFGLFAYDLNKTEIIFSVDLVKAVGIVGTVQGSYGTAVDVSKDGKTIVISEYNAETEERGETCFIDVPTQTYTRGEYKSLVDAYERETAKGFIYPGVKISQIKYILDDSEWYLFK